MKGYELCIIFQPDSSDAAMDELIATLSTSITKNGGGVVKTEKWGKRNLKFAIKKKTKGNFCFIFFNGTPEALKDIERIVRYDEQILRYTIIKAEKDINLTASETGSAAEAVAVEAAAAPAAAEAEAQQ